MRTVLLCLMVMGGMLLAPIPSQAATTLNYEYDANGSMVSGDGKYFEYNDANQLVRVRHGNVSGPVIAEYVYDYNGQRIKKVENGVTTYYVGKHFEQDVAGEKQTTTSYYFANGQRVAKKSLSDYRFYFSDHLGDIRIISDLGENLIQKIDYYPFGETRDYTVESYLYNGKEKDKVTGYYYYESRYYNNYIKHFVQADSIIPNKNNPQSLNRYAYVMNNPIKYIDPSGHSVSTFFKWFFRAIFGKSQDTASNSTSNQTKTPQNQTDTSEQVSKRKPLDNIKFGRLGFDDLGIGPIYSMGKGGTSGKEYHNGQDLLAKPDDKVYSPQEKVAITSTSYDERHGQLTVNMLGESGITYKYVHMANNESLASGQTYEAGSDIGVVGDGKLDQWSTAPHLHISTMRDGVYIDPRSVFEF